MTTGTPMASVGGIRKEYSVMRSSELRSITSSHV
jgi:hypothetical protein